MECIEALVPRTSLTDQPSPSSLDPSQLSSHHHLHHHNQQQQQQHQQQRHPSYLTASASASSAGDNAVKRSTSTSLLPSNYEPSSEPFVTPRRHTTASTLRRPSISTLLPASISTDPSATAITRSQLHYPRRPTSALEVQHQRKAPSHHYNLKPETVMTSASNELEPQHQPRSSLGGFLWGRRSMSTSSSVTAVSTPRATSFSSDNNIITTLDPIITTPSQNSPTLNYDDANGYASDEDNSSQFILARIEQQQPGSLSAPPTPGGREGKNLSTFEVFTSQLRMSFASVRDSVTGSAASAPTAAGDDGTEDIDWDFWGKVMNNYDDIARRQSRLLTKKLQHGIPDAIRGMVWQLMSKSKDTELEVTYRALLTRSSPHEKVIQRDLARTFPRHEHFATAGGSGQESLFNVIRAYSMYDSEVGYCQGIAFIAGPLLLNMPDEEAFCVLVKLMSTYNLRELFTPKMTGLQLRLYQFDKLLEEMLPSVAKHLRAQDIKSNMYASQWFMTMFAYRFPLDMVFRIMDIVFAEGFEAIFRFALALLKRNTDALLSLEFEQLLEFLKIGLFDIYIGNINALIQHAAAVHISKSKLDRMAVDHLDEMRKNDPELVTVDQLKSENRRLQDSVKRLETGYEQLNREHIELAKEHLDSRDAVERSNLRVEELRLQVEGLKSVLTEERLQAEAVVKEEMDRLARKNLELTAMNAELRDQVERLEEMVEAERRKLLDSETKREELQGRWDGLRAALR